MGLFFHKIKQGISLLTKVEADSGIGDLILNVLKEHGGEMAAHELLMVLYKRGRMYCEFDGKAFDIEFVIDEEFYPELKVYPDRGTNGWQVRFGAKGGRTGQGFKQVYRCIRQGSVMSIGKDNSIICDNTSSVVKKRALTTGHINHLLGDRIFDPNYKSTTLERKEI